MQLVKGGRAQCVFGILLLTCFLHSTAAFLEETGMVSVVPEKEYVPKGSNFTIYCRIDATMTSETAASLEWSRGIPGFVPGLAPDPPKLVPPNVRQVHNTTVASITLLDVDESLDDYYYCYLRGERYLQNTGHCDIKVFEPHLELNNLSCGAVNLFSFYCSWEEVDERYHEEYNATYWDAHESPPVKINMAECDPRQPTPGVPEGYRKACVPFTNIHSVYVKVRVWIALNSTEAHENFQIMAIVKPMKLTNLRVTDVTARSFRVTGGPPPDWVDPSGKFHDAELFLSDYEIQYAEDEEGADWVSVSTGSYRLDETIVDLVPDTLYKVRARSLHQSTYSDWSDIEKEVTKEAAPSGRVKHLGVETHPAQDGSRSLRVHWQDLKVSEKGSDDLVYYVAVIDRRTQKVVLEKDTTGREIHLTNISKFRAYTIRVTPGNKVGNGSATNTSVLDLSGTPGTPVSFHWEDFNATAGTLSWKDPKEPNAIIEKFIVEWRPLSEHEFQKEEVLKVEGVATTTLPLAGLSENTRYEFQVCAVSLKDGTRGEKAIIQGRTGSGLTVPIVFIIVPFLIMLVLIGIICLFRYHTNVKKSLPEPYFVESVKSSIYGQSPWAFNESQFFIPEKESFDTLRSVDDSTQLLGLDRMCSTEGSTSSSDQGIHDMDGHLTSTSSCTRLIPDDKAQEKGAVGGLRVVCEDLDKDSNDAVFPEDTCGLTDLTNGDKRRSVTPPNSPAVLSDHSSEEGDKLGAIGGAPCSTKFADLEQLSPDALADSRPLSSASEDSMSYMRVGENSTPMVVGTSTTSQEIPAGKTDVQETQDIQSDATVVGVTDQTPTQGEGNLPEGAGEAEGRHPSSSDEDLSGYCKQDVMVGVVPSVTSSGVSSMGEEYSRLADAGLLPSIPRQEAPPLRQQPPPPVDDPYVTVETMPLNIQQPSLSPSPQPAPYTSPYVTSEHAV